MKNNPRFFLFTAYGSQQFGLSFGHRKFFFRKQLFQANETPLETLARPKDMKRVAFRHTGQTPAHTFILGHTRSRGLGKRGWLLLPGRQTPAGPTPEGWFSLGKEGGLPFGPYPHVTSVGPLLHEPPSLCLLHLRLLGQRPGPSLPLALGSRLDLPTKSPATPLPPQACRGALPFLPRRRTSFLLLFITTNLLCEERTDAILKQRKPPLSLPRSTGRRVCRGTRM